MNITRKDTARVTPALLGASSLGLAALALVSLGLAAAPARAQTQDLFVSNAGNDTISRFAGTGPGTFSTTATTLTGGGLNVPQGLAFDARGDLFVANNGSNSVAEFAFNAASGTFGAAQTVETGLTGPSFLAFGPSSSAPVPEASTTVSFGLLLVLGLGGLVVAAKRKKISGEPAA